MCGHILEDLSKKTRYATAIRGGYIQLLCVSSFLCLCFVFA